MGKHLAPVRPRATKNALAQILDGHGRLASARDLTALIVSGAAWLGTFIAGAGFPTVALPYQIAAATVAGAGAMSLTNQLIRFARRYREGYAWGLSFENISVTLSVAGPLQIGIRLRNATSGHPLEYQVERYHVVMGNRAIANPDFANDGGIITNGGESAFLYPAFEGQHVLEFRGKDVEGSVEADIVYGPPARFVRRLHLKTKTYISISADGKEVSFQTQPIETTDEPI